MTGSGRMNGPTEAGSLITAAKDFACDYGRYAGRRGLFAAVLVGGRRAGHVGIVMLVPILTVVLGGGVRIGRVRGRTILDLLATVGAQTRFQSAVLLALFAVLLCFAASSRSCAMCVWRRLQIGFVEQKRSGIIRLLTTARWDMSGRPPPCSAVAFDEQRCPGLGVGRNANGPNLGRARDFG